MLCYTHFGVFLISVNIWVGRDGVDGVSTYSVWEGPTVEYMWGQYFPHQSKPTQEPPCFVCNRVLGLLHGVERWVGGVDCSPRSIAEVQERAQYWIFFPGWSGGWVALTTKIDLLLRCKKEHSTGSFSRVERWVCGVDH